MSDTAENDALHGNGPCALCGKDPASGYASSWDAATDTEAWYCHGDDDESPTCYERHGWENPIQPALGVQDLASILARVIPPEVGATPPNA